MATQEKYVAPITRFYVDIRPMIHSGDLLLLETLPPDQRTSITRFIRPADRLMSLASALLKYIFIHRRAQIPWDEVLVRRTPHPHRRPYWEPESDWAGEGGLEFNVTHQAGLVALVGCKTPVSQTAINTSSPVITHSNHACPLPAAVAQPVRLGVDVACTNEEKRTPKDLNTQSKLDEWIDIFGEMFSDQERHEMKRAPISNVDVNADLIAQKLRRFYAFWALKEAYIKMVGEGLLANWLKELEFSNVIAPHPTQNNASDDGFSWALRDEEDHKWTPTTEIERETAISMYKRKVEDVETEISAYEKDYLFATAMRGVTEPTEGKLTAHWIKLDIERDIRPCAEGRCHCLERQLLNRATPVRSPISPTQEPNSIYNGIDAQLTL